MSAGHWPFDELASQSSELSRGGGGGGGGGGLVLELSYLSLSMPCSSYSTPAVTIYYYTSLHIMGEKP